MFYDEMTVAVLRISVVYCLAHSKELKQSFKTNIILSYVNIN